MSTNSPVKSSFASPDLAELSKTSIFNNIPGNSDVLYIKNTSKKNAPNEGNRKLATTFNPLNHLTDLANSIKERKELRQKIKKIFNDRGIKITKEIRAALPNTFNRGNSIKLRSTLKEKLSGHDFIQMEFFSMMTSHINEGNFSGLLATSNIFSEHPNILNEVNSILKNEMSAQAADIARDIFSTASKARVKYFSEKTNPGYESSMRNLNSEADKEAFQAASIELFDKFSKIRCGSDFTALTRALAISLDKAIEISKPNSNSISEDETKKLREKIIEGLLLSSFTKFLADEVKAKSKSFPGSMPFESLVFLLENLISGGKTPLSTNDIRPQTSGKVKFKSQDFEKIKIDFSSLFKFPESFQKIRASLATREYSKFWPSGK